MTVSAADAAFASTQESPVDLRRERVLIVGNGRMGQALAAALTEAAGEGRIARVTGPVGRASGTQHGADADVVLLTVPDAAIADAARDVAPGRLVGHLSGATSLAPLAPHEAFSLHPLTTVTGARSRFAGAAAAVAGTTDRARRTAAGLAALLGMTPREVADRDRATYHAAASIASNFLVTIEGFAEELAGTVGVDRAALVPLVRAAVENWADAGAAGALTGPIARGDDETVARQRAAVAERLPGRLPLFDALVAATRDAVAARPKSEGRNAQHGGKVNRGDGSRGHD